MFRVFTFKLSQAQRGTIQRTKNVEVSFKKLCLTGEKYIPGGARRVRKCCLPHSTHNFCNFLCSQSKGKNMNAIFPLGKKNYFPTLLRPLLIIFPFPQGRANRIIYNPGLYLGLGYGEKRQRPPPPTLLNMYLH